MITTSMVCYIDIVKELIDWDLDLAAILISNVYCIKNTRVFMCVTLSCLQEHTSVYVCYLELSTRTHECLCALP